MRFSWTISRYLIGAVLPYFIFSWLLLSVILFVQQAGRFSDIFFTVNIPSSLVWQLTIALIPNVIAFTCPMAALVGVIIGLSKMQGDSELVAIRASGIGNFQITAPLLLLGLLLSAFALAVNLYGVPMAAGMVRKVAMQTAIYKLESPIEPGVFNSEIAGYTIYVKTGDLAKGEWKNIFIYNEDPKAGLVRLITSTNGRIDYSGEISELVLDNAVVSTISKSDGADKFVSEKVGEIRYTVKTRRGDLVEKLGNTETSPEELGLVELSRLASTLSGSERTEAQILWQRRIILSITPFVFCILGTSMVLRFHRRGRGFGIFVALLALIVYYLLAFLGEQLARTGRLSVTAGSLIPLTVSALAIAWFYVSSRLNLAVNLNWLRLGSGGSLTLPKLSSRRPNFFVDLTTGLRDFDIIANLFKFYLLTLGFLTSVFIIFTAFELWKFAGTTDGGIFLLLKYLLFLVPFIYIQLSPSSAMVATLATYVIKSRQNEIVTWTSAGQSVYRLLLPCLIATAALGIFNFQLQERVLPTTNRIQDDLRTRIRNRGIGANKDGRYWVATDKRIYSFGIGPASDNEISFDRETQAGEIPTSESSRGASDNEKGVAQSCPPECYINDLTIYDFADKGAELQSIYQTPSAVWEDGRIRFLGRSKVISIDQGRSISSVIDGGELSEASNPLFEFRKKPSHLNIAETRVQIAATESDVERRSFQLALHKKYTTLLLPCIIAMFTAPFALSLSRKGKVVTVGLAVALWLSYMGISSAFDQFGLNGMLDPKYAVWAPLALFSMLGIFLLSKVRT